MVGDIDFLYWNMFENELTAEIENYQKALNQTEKSLSEYSKKVGQMSVELYELRSLLAEEKKMLSKQELGELYLKYEI